MTESHGTRSSVAFWPALIRQIARELQLARNTVSRVLARREEQRAGARSSRARGGPAGSIPTSRSSRNCWHVIPS